MQQKYASKMLRIVDEPKRQAWLHLRAVLGPKCIVEYMINLGGLALLANRQKNCSKILAPENRREKEKFSHFFPSIMCLEVIKHLNLLRKGLLAQRDL